MKITNFKLTLAMLSLCCAFTSCSDDDDDYLDDSNSKVELARPRAFILNEGSINMNNAGIEYFNPSKSGDIISDIYFTQNAQRLGDVGQDMIEYNGYIYVSVYGSNYLAKLNAAGVQVAACYFANEPLLQAGIRYIAAEDGYIYASFYGGVVAKISADDLKVVATLQTTGKNLEGVAIEDDYLYVANSYERVTNPETGKNKYNYFKEVLVIDLKNFTYKETVTVDSNPNKVAEEDDKIFVVSNDYSQESYVLQMIEPRNGNKVTRIGYATNFAAGDDMLYMVDSRTDYSSKPYVTTNTFKSYDIKSGKLNETSFLKNAPAELTTASVYAMAVNEDNGDIYILVTQYSAANGDVYRFNRDGSFVEKFDCGGQNPRAMVFFE
ncbi:MAG: hypothetical protein NC098_04060 [Lachnoclostridium sp.]|nr:hypothetical protein [Lachnoclostridium sp.]